MATLQTRCEVANEVLSRELDGELVILSLEHGAYFSVNATGNVIWQTLASGGAVNDACDRLESEFSASRSQIERDVLAFVDRVVASGLVRTTC